MSNRTGRPKVSPMFVALACITLLLASWGLFRLFVDHGNMPHGLAVFVVCGLDLAAVLCGKHALDVAEDGDSSAPWNAALLALVGLGAYAQFARARLDGDPAVIGIVSAAFPVVTVLLFEGQLRRVYRLNGRRSGRLSMPRATVDLVTWLFFTKLATRATKLAVLDRGLDTDSALTIAERQLAIEQAEADKPRERRSLRRTYAAELGSGQIIEVESQLHRPPRPDTDPDNGGGRPDDRPDNAPDEELSVSDVRQRGDLARAVDEARNIVGDDAERIVRIVRLKYPDAVTETILRTIRRRAV
jgi:hypothetical protein